MPKFKSTLTPAERQPQQLVIPDRVQKIIDLYSKNHIEYPWTQEDRDDQIFEYRKSRNETTAKYNITRIDRVRNYRRTEEYFFFQKKQSVMNENNVREESRELTYGFAVEKYCEDKYNDRTNTKEPTFIRDVPTYFFKWDKDEVRKLLEGSEEPCRNFYLGDMGDKGQGESSSSRNIVALTHSNAEQDFIDGSFDDLVLIAKSPYSGSGSALGLVARLKEEQDKQALGKMRETQKKV